jgi:hypothetical protein
MRSEISGLLGSDIQLLHQPPTFFILFVYEPGELRAAAADRLLDEAKAAARFPPDLTFLFHPTRPREPDPAAGRSDRAPGGAAEVGGRRQRPGLRKNSCIGWRSSAPSLSDFPRANAKADRQETAGTPGTAATAATEPPPVTRPSRRRPMPEGGTGGSTLWRRKRPEA